MLFVIYKVLTPFEMYQATKACLNAGLILRVSVKLKERFKVN